MDVHHYGAGSICIDYTYTVLHRTSHTESASRTQWARRGGWRPAACVPGICSSIPWGQSGMWSWCCWVNLCSCRRRSVALCCAAGRLCALNTSGGTSALTTAAPVHPSGPCYAGWDHPVELRSWRSWRGGPSPSMCQQDGWHRPAAREWSQEPCGWSWQYANPPGCGQWWTAERQSVKAVLDEMEQTRLKGLSGLEI